MRTAPPVTIALRPVKLMRLSNKSDQNKVEPNLIGAGRLFQQIMTMAHNGAQNRVSNSLPNSGLPTSGGPRRIAFCITDLDPGGAEKALFQIVSRLNRDEWDPVVFCLGPEAALAKELRKHDIVTLCYGARSWRSLGVIPWLVKELRFYRPALLQCFLFHANVAGRIAGQMAGVPLILSGHRVAERQKKWHLWLDRLTGSAVDYHVCVSQGVADFLQQTIGLDARKVTVIPNGVEPPRLSSQPVNLREEFQFPPGAPVILAVGRLHPQKGFLELLEAFSKLRPEVPDARMLIVGEGPQRAELEARIRDLQLSGFARLAGYRTDVADLMLQSQVLVMSSRWEGMPNVLLEAVQLGLPVVATPVEGVAEVQKIAPELICVTGDLTMGLRETLARTRWDASLRRGELESPQVVPVQCLGWDFVSMEYSNLYHRLLSNGG